MGSDLESIKWKRWALQKFRILYSLHS